MMGEKRWLLLILAVYATLALAYSWIVPLGESPDEVDHFLYVRHLVEARAIPIMHPVAADNVTMEANQPPLFYLLNAVVNAPFPMTASADFPLNDCFTFNSSDGGRAHFYLHESAEQHFFSTDYLAFRVARMLSVFLGTITIGLAYGLGQQMQLAGRHSGLLAAGFLAFNPQFIFITASVNNDVLTAVIGATLVYYSILASRSPTIKRFVGLGILMGLGLLTKYALIAFWPLPLLAVLLGSRNGRLPRTLQYGAIVFGLPILIAGWWYIRAFQLYGDPLIWDVHLQAKGGEVLRTSAFTWADLRDFAVIHFQSYWAWFGWLKIQAAGWIYSLLAVGVFMAAVGLLLLLRDALKEARKAEVNGLLKSIHTFPGLTAVLFSSLAVAAIYTSLFRYIQTINWSGYQGRLAYAAAAPIAALLALGWGRLAGAVGQTRKGILLINMLPVACLGLLALSSLAQLNTAFARPALYTPPTSWTRVCQSPSPDIYIEAVSYPPVVEPGEPLTVLLSGYGDQEVTAVGEVALLDWEGILLDTAVSDLSWAVGTPVTDTVHLVVPQATLPMRARLVYFLGDEFITLGQLKIAAGQTAVPISTQAVSANFAEEIRLLGYDLQTGSDVIRLATYWQLLHATAEDFTIFVHLLDENGVLIAQQDAQPQGGRYPTSIWDVGEVVMDEAVLSFSADAQPAEIIIGLYHQATLERLPLVGEVVGDTAVGQSTHILLPLQR